MPAQTTSTSLMAKLGAKVTQAHAKHAADETTYGIINLPAGISGGVAQLVMAKCDVHKAGHKQAGKPYVTLQGVALTPKEHDGVRVEGQRVSQVIPMYDTPDRNVDGVPGTFEAWYAKLLNEFRKLGVDTVKNTNPDLILAALQKGKPYFAFSTRGWQPPPTPQKPKPEPMVFTQFDGLADNPFSANGEAAEHSALSAVDDTSAAAGPGDGADGLDGEEPVEGGEEVSADSFSEFDDMDALVRRAEADEQDAKDKLEEMAIAAGYTSEDVNEAESWGLVKAMIEAPKTRDAGGGPTTATATADEPNWEGPVAEEIYRYRPIDPRTKKPVKKAVDVEVLTVSKKNKTVKVKILDTQKEVDKVPWDALESGE